MNALSWPYDNYYFNFGVRKILKSFNSDSLESLYIINLSDNSVIDLLQSDIYSIIANCKALIVYTKRQEALANYLVSHHSKILAAFSVTNCIIKIQEFILDNHVLIEPSHHLCLTTRQYQALCFYVRGHSVIRQARELNLDVKTIYSHRRQVVVKMGLRKISDVFRRI